MQYLLRLATKFAQITHDPFEFFHFTDENAARDSQKDHAMQRAFERTNPHQAQKAIDFANKVISGLYKNHPELVVDLAEGSEWSLPCPGDLIAIMKKTNNQLVNVTFLKEGQIIPKTVSGHLEHEIRRLHTLRSRSPR